MRQCILVLVFAFLSHSEPRIRPDTWAVPVIETNLENLHCVDSGIFRSEQPHRKDADDLFSLGIREVLNLRNFHSDGDDFSDKRFVLHRVKSRAGKMDETEIIKALQIIKKRKSPVLVHCWHGSDRTGVIIAAYRIVFNKWSKDQALDEMVNGRFGFHLKKFPNLIRLIEKLDVDAVKKSLQL